MNGASNPNMAAAQGGGGAAGGSPMPIQPATASGVAQGLASSGAGTPYAGYNPFAGGGQQQQQTQQAFVPGPSFSGINTPAPQYQMNANGANNPLAAFSQAVGGLGQYMPQQPGQISAMSPAQISQLMNWQPPSSQPQQVLPTQSAGQILAASQAAQAAQAQQAALPMPAIPPSQAAAAAAIQQQATLQGYTPAQAASAAAQEANGVVWPVGMSGMQTAGQPIPAGQVDPGGNWDAGPTG